MSKQQKPLIVTISGLPATGKTSIGNQLSREFDLPFISKDGVKELLFDSLGYSDREWSRKLGKATYPIMYYFAEAELKAKRSFILESNFNPMFETETFKMFKEKYSCDILVVNCITNGEVLYKRFIERAKKGERHPGHGDHLYYEEFKDLLLSGKSETFEIGSKIIEVETTNLDQIDLSEVRRYLKSNLSFD